ncbi:hypothetical protein DFJ58DRAFT_723355 [Suillus subalutaceus]|uniref:uncharacterized protein n=1 Tax=Suillus subalutaceus TaxID=48586 RepID=UPI001B86B3B2|nr:uncharacterized protein DFJ58DRAFT_723355 [Suillus subalutaceus]KAG1868948.1 hypothetical protein DFJ58DRAFT_723355 [Suillus subalutaceus]
MRGGVHLKSSKKLAPGVESIKCNIKAGFPSNTFLVVDTHLDEYTRMLQHTGGHAGSTNTTITEILLAYLGEDFVKSMKASSEAGRSDETVKKTMNGNAPRCNLTPRARGGWRGLFMVSCGPAIRVSHYFEAMKGLVDNDFVDFVLAFGGSGTLPSMVSNTVCSFIMDTRVFRRTDIWSAVCELMASSNEFLDYTTAVVVFASTVDKQRIVECHQIGKDNPGSCALDTSSSPVPPQVVHLRCLKCNRRSVSTKTDMDNKHFKRVNKLVAPQLFWHHFPRSTDLQNYFVELTNNEQAQPHQNKGKKGGDKQGKSKCRAEIVADVQDDSEMAGDQ